ncbi:hypothetical protein DSECCO2_334860 [anaerobic digester metagenome]
MLHLQPGVHLHEVVVPVRVEELHRAGVLVVRRLCRGDGRRRHLLPESGRHDRAGRLLEQFLVPALDRALAVVEVDGVPLRVGKNLDLDVARLREILLHEDRRIAEGGLGDPHPLVDRLLELALVLGDVHPDTAAARARLHDHRVADLGGDLLRLLDARDALRRARKNRDAGLPHHPLRPDLRAQRLDRLPRRPDERQALFLDQFREPGVLREESVARVDRLGPGLSRHVADPLLVEVTLRRVRLPDAERLVGVLDVERVVVRLGVDRDRVDAQFPAGTHDPDGDLAAVGNQDLVKVFHRASQPLTQ